MEVECNIESLVLGFGSGVVLLGDGKKSVAIHIGGSDASALALAIAEEKTPRPFTHEVCLSILKEAGASMKKVVVDQLKGGVFHAKIYVDVPNDGGVGTKVVDARSSDSIVFATREKIPIYVEDVVLEEANVPAGDRKVLVQKNAIPDIKNGALRHSV
jgi:bifunctional DNase/RNase